MQAISFKWRLTTALQKCAGGRGKLASRSPPRDEMRQRNRACARVPSLSCRPRARDRRPDPQLPDASRRTPGRFVGARGAADCAGRKRGSEFARHDRAARRARPFLVEARVDGRLINFMVDTGASVIALTVSDAARLGIHPAQRDFTVEVRTANGSVRAAPARLDKVEVGDFIVRDVAAVILPDGALSDNLLGLSFLSRLRRFEYSDGRLVLEQ